jgi:hypothetical protein
MASGERSLVQNEVSQPSEAPERSMFDVDPHS